MFWVIIIFTLFSFTKTQLHDIPAPGVPGNDAKLPFDDEYYDDDYDVTPYMELWSEFKNREFYENMVTGLPLIPNVTLECVEDLGMIFAVLLNKSQLLPGFDQIVAQSSFLEIEEKFP